ncbi:MAG: NAD-dependent epimerase/dehydratase family protein [Lautropia sp.]|nr:NAD-dependent epimerase/dehydratase family protein [Lautropia sp.]
MDDSTRIATVHAVPTAAAEQQTIVLTGAAGFIGLHLIRHLLAAGHAVRAITRQPEALAAAQAAWTITPPSEALALPAGAMAQPADATMQAATGHLAKSPAHAGSPALTIHRHPGFGPTADWHPILAGADAVIHSAGIAHIPLDATRTSQQRLREVNVAGVRELARAAAHCGLKQLVFLSSVKATGEWSTPGMPLREGDTPRPEDCYGLAKLAAEHHLARLARQHPSLRITSLRPPLIYGPGVKANFAALLTLAQSGLPLPLARLANERSFLYVGNLADAITTVLASPDQAGGLFHLSDGPPISTPELIRAIASAAGKPARLLPVPPPWLAKAARLAGRESIWQRLAGSLAVSNDAFCQRFDWRPPYTMQQGLAETLKGQTP